VEADDLVELGVRRASERVVRIGLRFRSDDARAGVKAALQRSAVRRLLRDVLRFVGVADLDQRPPVDGGMAAGKQGLASGGIPALRQRDEVCDVAFQALGFAQRGSRPSVNETG